MQTIKVIGTISERQTAHGEIVMSPIPKSVRFQRGLRNLLICFGLMVIGALIPMLHLILLFGFFSLGIFLFFNSYLDDIEISSGEIICEKCQSKIAFGPKPDLFPIWVDCPVCKESIAVKKET